MPLTNSAHLEDINTLRMLGTNVRKLQTLLLNAELLVDMCVDQSTTNSDFKALRTAVETYKKELEHADKELELFASKYLLKWWNVRPGRQCKVIKRDESISFFYITSVRASPFKDCLDIILLGRTDSAELNHLYVEEGSFLEEVSALSNVIDFAYHRKVRRNGEK